MTGEFINGSQSIIRRQWRLSHYGSLISHLFVKFVNSSREAFTRVVDTRAGSDSIRIDELMILMNLYYHITNQRLTSARCNWGKSPGSQRAATIAERRGTGGATAAPRRVPR